MMSSEIKKIEESENAVQSKTIDWLRFPMVLLVVFVHQNPRLIKDPSSFVDLIYNVIAGTFSFVLAGVAVPMFFFFSGFLYFYRVNEWNKDLYIKKTKKRFKGLVVPYFLWNLIAFFMHNLVVFAKGFVNNDSTASLQNFNLNIFWNISSWPNGKWCFGLLDASNAIGPQDEPLWYLRNLIILILIAPLIYVAIKNFGKFFMVLLFLAYLSNIWIPYHPLCITGFFFFCFGASISIYQKNIVIFFAKFKNTAFIMAPFLALYLIVSYVYGDVLHIRFIVRPAFILSGLIAVYCLVYFCEKKGSLPKQPAVLAQSSFFVFAVHQLSVNSSVSAVVHKLFDTCLGGGRLLEILSYIMTPLLVCLSCVLLYLFLKKFMPVPLKLLTGNR